MPVTSRKLRPELRVLGCVVALALVAFAAIRLIGGWLETRPRAASESTVETASAALMQKPKERARYQATIENWRRYRAANAPN
jgi:hypothetical protein